MNDNPALRQSPQADTAPRTAETLLPPVDVIEDAAGIRPDRERLVLVLALALVVAVALKVVGALLIAAMLIGRPRIEPELSRNSMVNASPLAFRSAPSR